MLGQLAHRKLLGTIEERLRAWAAVRYPGASQAGHHELDGLLQLPQIAFELGLPQPHAIRETLVRGTAQKSRVSRELRTPQNRGNINVLDVIEGGVDHENLDADEVIELAEQYGYFVNENTLEPELFAGGLAQDMQEVIREELPRLRRETLNALQQWVDDPDQVDEDWLLRLIERIGKGRFAQALAPSVSQDVCPAYIRSALEHIRDAIA